MYITINSEFKPFTYDELTKPLRDYTEAYNKVEEQYATLAQQTEAWKNIATQENSPEAYAMYKKYSDELNAVVEDFSRGMTIQNRGKLTGLKSRYASEITPIATAYELMQEANTYRDTVKGQDDTAVFNVDRYTSLDSFINGQAADNNFISGKGIQDNIAKQVLSESYNEYNRLITEGHSKRAAAKIVSKGEWLNEEDILNNIYASTGITTEDAAAKVKAYTDNGIIQGISTFYVDTDASILGEELEKARIDGSGNGDSKESPGPNMDELMMRAFDIMGLSTEREVVETSVTEEGSNGEFKSTTTNSYTKPLTKEEMLASAYSNPDSWFIIDLLNVDIPEDDIRMYYQKYIEAKKINPSEASSFENYVKNLLKDE